MILRVSRDQDGRSISARRVVVLQYALVISSLSVLFHRQEPEWCSSLPAQPTSRHHPSLDQPGDQSIMGWWTEIFDIRLPPCQDPARRTRRH